MTLKVAVAVVCVLLLGVSPSANGQSDDVLSQAGFGWSVAVAETDILVGEPLNARFSGRVYVFRKSDGEWKNVQIIEPAGAKPENGFGASIVVSGSRAGVVASEEDQDRVYLFRRSADGTWAQEAVLEPGDWEEDDQLGEQVAIVEDVVFATLTKGTGGSQVVVFQPHGVDKRWSEVDRVDLPESSVDNMLSPIVAGGGKVFVGAPGFEGGAVFELRKVDGSWNLAKVFQDVSDDADATSLFGTSLLFVGGRLVVTAPEYNDGAGAVFVLDLNDSGSYDVAQQLSVNDGARQFGSVIVGTASGLQIATYDADLGTGAVYLFEKGADGLYKAAGTIKPNILEEEGEYATSMASSANLLVVGAYADLFGYGSASVYERGEAGAGWVQTTLLKPVLNYGQTSITGEMVKCSDGSAAQYDCSNVDLLSFVSNADLGSDWGIMTNDVWGWTDPESGKEYAIVCTMDATVFIDVSDPYKPVVLGRLPLSKGTRPNWWHDAKVYKNHAYIVADNAGPAGLQIFDLTQLRDVENPPAVFEETARYDGFGDAHNIVINEESGFAYVVGISGGGQTCGGGSHILDLNDPVAPKFVGCFAHEGTGEESTGYTHDSQCVIYHGPDERYSGHEICIGANETALSIADFTDKKNIVPIAVARYPNVSYAHQGWFSEDQRYFYQNDETDEINGLTDGTRTLVWDFAELDDPVLLDEYVSTDKSTDHNMYVKGSLMYQSNYLSGLRVVDVSNPHELKDAGHFDTVPYGENKPGYGGSWSNYPFFKSGTIVVTSGEEGVFFLKRSEATP